MLIFDVGETEVEVQYKVLHTVIMTKTITELIIDIEMIDHVIMMIDHVILNTKVVTIETIGIETKTGIEETTKTWRIQDGVVIHIGMIKKVGTHCRESIMHQTMVISLMIIRQNI